MSIGEGMKLAQDNVLYLGQSHRIGDLGPFKMPCQSTSIHFDGRHQFGKTASI